MRRTKRNLHGFGWVNISKLAAAAVLLTACLSFRTAAQQHGQKTFSTADDAVSTLVTAMQNNDEKALLEILGPDARQIVSSGDDVEDREAHANFVQKYQEMHRFVKEPDGSTVLYIGAMNWPAPIPLMKKGNAWYFDTEAGKKEILYRRVGRNELSAIRICQELVAAQKEYFSLQGSEYAQKIFSSEGQHNGLYWKPSASEPQSPIGPRVAEAVAEGFTQVKIKVGAVLDDDTRRFAVARQAVGDEIGIATPAIATPGRRDGFPSAWRLWQMAKGGAKIFEDFKRIGNKFPEVAAAITKKSSAQDGDLIVLVAGSAQAGPQTAMPAHRKVTPAELAIYASAGLLRLALAQKYSERHSIFTKSGDAAKDFRFLWVTNFPMFEWDESEHQWMAAHHPFTSPHEEDMSLLEAGVESVNDPQSPLSAVRALAYDVVLNGTELGSGSIRIHRQDIQRKIFRALGMTEEEAKSRFGFFLEALEYGTPPHGGIALGLDRIVMILAGAESLREVIPFPKTARAVDLMCDAPTPVSERQLRELGISVKK